MVKKNGSIYKSFLSKLCPKVLKTKRRSQTGLRQTILLEGKSPSPEGVADGAENGGKADPG